MDTRHTLRPTRRRKQSGIEFHIRHHGHDYGVGFWEQILDGHFAPDVDSKRYFSRFTLQKSRGLGFALAVAAVGDYGHFGRCVGR